MGYIRSLLWSIFEGILVKAAAWLSYYFSCLMWYVITIHALNPTPEINDIINWLIDWLIDWLDIFYSSFLTKYM